MYACHNFGDDVNGELGVVNYNFEFDDKITCRGTTIKHRSGEPGMHGIRCAMALGEPRGPPTGSDAEPERIHNHYSEKAIEWATVQGHDNNVDNHNCNHDTECPVQAVCAEFEVEDKGWKLLMQDVAATSKSPPGTTPKSSCRGGVLEHGGQPSDHGRVGEVHIDSDHLFHATPFSSHPPGRGRPGGHNTDANHPCTHGRGRLAVAWIGTRPSVQST